MQSTAPAVEYAPNGQAALFKHENHAGQGDVQLLKPEPVAQKPGRVQLSHVDAPPDENVPSGQLNELLPQRHMRPDMHGAHTVKPP